MTADRIFLFAVAVGVCAFLAGVLFERARVRAIARLQRLVRDRIEDRADADLDRRARRLAAAFHLECLQRGIDIRHVDVDAHLFRTPRLP